MEPKDTFPVRTLAGSSMKHLTEDLTALRQYLEGAINKLIQATPHPRDYIHDEEKYKAARQVHDVHLMALKGMRRFYQEKEIHCHDQIPK